MKSTVQVNPLRLKFTSSLASIYISVIPAALLAHRISENAVIYLSFVIYMLIG